MGDQFYALSPTASEYWELLSAGLTQDRIRQEILRRYEIEEEALDIEVSRLTNELLTARLVLNEPPR
jgi:hypothetical protein